MSDHRHNGYCGVNCDPDARDAMLARAEFADENERLRNHVESLSVRAHNAEAERDACRAHNEHLREMLGETQHRLRLLAERTGDYTAEGLAIRLRIEADAVDMGE